MREDFTDEPTPRSPVAAVSAGHLLQRRTAIVLATVVRLPFARAPGGAWSLHERCRPVMSRVRDRRRVRTARRKTVRTTAPVRPWPIATGRAAYDAQMPFTGSHPAAVVPLLRTGLVPSALVIGSMIPDLPYYVPVPVSWTATHSMPGVIGIDVVLGVLVFVLWQVLLAPTAVALAPVGFRERLAPELPVRARHHCRNARAIALVLVSLAVGAATHVAWDLLTHADRWGTDHVAWLAASHGPLPGYRWMQYAGGLLGAIVLVAVAARWWVTTPTAPGAQRIPALSRRTAVGWATTLALCTFGAAAAGLATGFAEGGARTAAFFAATWGGGAAAAATLVCAAACAPRVLGQARAPAASDA